VLPTLARRKPSFFFPRVLLGSRSLEDLYPAVAIVTGFFCKRQLTEDGSLTVQQRECRLRVTM
jgi:hypothetical protein